METFYSIQGEGYYQGHAAFFIRLAGCDVGCVWCDVKESWNAEEHPRRSVEDILEEIKDTEAKIVIVTGGEPLLYDCTSLCMALRKQGYKVHLETSGSHPLTGEWDWICLSPKKFKAPLKEVISKAHELKVVVYNRSDFQWAENYAALVSASCQLYLQPEWDKEKEMITLITSYIQSNPKWQLSLQIHKYIGVR